MGRFVSIILAAGKGKRMKSRTAKILHPICGKPMLSYVLELVRELKTEKTILVVGTQKEEVIREFRDWDVEFIEQEKPLGTGDAVLKAEKALKDIDSNVIVLAGDTPLLSRNTIETMMELHSDHNVDVTLLSTILEEPSGYGRILRDGKKVVGIVEEKDTSEAEKSIKEINAGVYIFNKDKLFRYLKDVKPNNIQKEYYLTDIVRLIQKERGKIEIFRTDDWKETIGINDRWILSFVSKIIEQRIMKGLMKNGVTIVCPESTYIDYGVKVEKESLLEPFVSLTGKTLIDEDSRIHSHCSIHNSVVGKNVEIGENCLLIHAHIPDNSVIPAHSIIKDEKEEKKE